VEFYECHGLQAIDNSMKDISTNIALKMSKCFLMEMAT